MTNAIETTKREMYRAFIDVQRQLVQENIPSLALGKCVSMGKFESALENHLAELQKACDGHEALHQTARQRFEDIQALDRKCESLQSELARVTTERDSYRNRLQAIDHELRPEYCSATSQRQLDEKSMRMRAMVDSVADCVVPKMPCMHSFFAIGDDQMKCTFCGVEK